MSFLVPPRRPSRERLDDPALPVDEMRRNLEDLGAIGRRWGATRDLARYVAARSRALGLARVRVLDVGAGSGEGAAGLRRELSRTGLTSDVLALDLRWRRTSSMAKQWRATRPTSASRRRFSSGEK